jgi:ABC-2 type transport system permease protein
MYKTLIIASREYQAMVRTKAFLVMVVLMPIFMGGAIVAQKLLQGRVDASDKTIVVLDGTGVLFDDLTTALAQANEREILDRPGQPGARQVRPRLVLERGPAGPISDETRLSLSERVRKSQIIGFVEIDPDILQPAAASAEGLPDAPRAAFCSDNLAAVEAGRRFVTVLRQIVTDRRLRSAGLDPAVVKQATARVDMKNLGLYVKTAEGVKNTDESGNELTRMIPFGMMMLMFMSVMLGAQPMLQTVLEEKQQRIAEVLLGSAQPFELMMGKLLGNVGVSLTILGIYFSGIYYTARSYGFMELLPTELLGWFLVYDILAVLLFGSIFIAVGAMCNDLKEAQNYLLPVTLLLVFPIMVWFEVMRSPMSLFATVLSLIPLATPMLMLLRMGTTSAVPLWQPLLGIVGMLAATALCVFAAGRVFRIGLLAQGKAPKLTELVRWVVQG